MNGVPRQILSHRNKALAVAIIAVGLLAACGDDADDANDVATPDQEVVVTAVDYAFSSSVPPEFSAGETVRFEFVNDGELIHDMQVLDSDGTRLAATRAIGPGESTELTVTFDEAGVYQLICDVDDHLTTHDMRAAFEVTE